MNIRNCVPFLRILLPFLSGIIFTILSDTYFHSLLFTFPIYILIVALFIYTTPLNTSFRYAWCFGFIINITFFIAGVFITNLNTEKYKANHFGHHLKNSEYFLVKINEPYLEKEKSYKTIATVVGVRQKERWIPTTGKVLLFLSKDSVTEKIKYGDLLLVNTKFNSINALNNPEEFNYKQFLSYKNIYHQAYINSKQQILVAENQGNIILKTGYNLRNYLLTIYRNNHISGDEYAVASALIVGYDDLISKELIRAYAGTGTLHVLSVSGLHIGIVYILLNYLFIFFEKIKYGKTVKYILILLTLWFYAVLTGLSPSVLRSALMFSIFATATRLGWNINVYNTLSFTCFVLLLINPFSITDVGFQLSFLAVLGIVTIQPWLYERYKPNNWFINKIWVLTSVSVAAQIATFPLSIYYFHQFPNYFIFSNLIAIPLSGIILIYGLVMFVAGSIPLIATMASQLFFLLVRLLNQFVIYSENLPYAVWKGLFISSFGTIILFMIITSSILFIYNKRPSSLIISLSLIVIFLGIQVRNDIMFKDQNKLIIYNIPSHSAYDYLKGKNVLFFCDSSLTAYPDKINYHLQNNRLASHVVNTSIHTLSGNNFMQFNAKRIVIINQKLKSKNLQKKISVDLLVLSGNAVTSIRQLNELFSFGKIIIDSSNKKWKADEWEKECKELHINCYSVLRSGAYIENIF